MNKNMENNLERYYYFCPTTYQFSGDGDFYLENSTKKCPPEFDISIEKAFFDNKNQEWKIVKDVYYGIFINNKTLEIKNSILAEEKDNYIDELTFIKEKKNQLRKEYEESQKMILKNGVEIKIVLCGDEYNRIYQEFRKNINPKTNIAKDIIIFDYLHNRNYKMNLPKSFGKQLLSKVQEVSRYNYNLLKQQFDLIDREKLSIEQIANLKIDFKKDQILNIDKEILEHSQDKYIIANHPQDIEWIVNNKIFTPLNND
jgi:hypothetical protein